MRVYDVLKTMVDRINLNTNSIAGDTLYENTKSLDERITALEELVNDLSDQGIVKWTGNKFEICDNIEELPDGDKILLGTNGILSTDKGGTGMSLTHLWGNTNTSTQSLFVHSRDGSFSQKVVINSKSAKTVTFDLSSAFPVNDYYMMGILAVYPSDHAGSVNLVSVHADPGYAKIYARYYNRTSSKITITIQVQAAFIRKHTV